MYKKKVLEFLYHPLISGSAILIIGGLISSLFNFLFNLFTSRNLSVSEYGTVASLLSIIALSTMPAGAITSTVVRFAATYFARNELGKVKSMFIKISKTFLLLGILSLFIFVIFSNQIGNFFNINKNMLIILVGINVFAAFIAITNASILQAKLSFKFLVSLNILGSSLKLLFGILFIVWGFSVVGVMWAFFLSTIIAYTYSFIPLKFLFDTKIKETNVQIRHFAQYGIPATIALFSLSSFITSDILLVKHFFSQADAGLYAGLSLVGRVIFFLSAPIATVMFPMIVQRYARQEKVFKLFLFSLTIVIIPSCILTGVYYLFPDLVIKFFLKKDAYLQIAGLLGFFGLFITSYSALVVITNFYLSIKKISISIPLGIGAIAQIVLIWFYHKDFSQIIFISFVLCSLLSLFLLFYYVFSHEKVKSIIKTWITVYS